ncbi:MAG: hypothetical protein RR057_03700 [Clostridia bacterium]
MKKAIKYIFGYYTIKISEKGIPLINLLNERKIDFGKIVPCDGGYRLILPFFSYAKFVKSAN